MTLDRWGLRMLELAALVATWSKDPSTRCGAVLTDARDRHAKQISVGYNGPPPGFPDDDPRLGDRGFRLSVTIHAEENALLSTRCDVRGWTMYVVPVGVCGPCAAKIVRAGVERVVCVAPETVPRWGGGYDILRTCGVQVDNFWPGGAEWDVLERFGVLPGGWGD